MTTTAVTNQYLYDLPNLHRLPVGTHSATAHASVGAFSVAVVTGSHAHVALVRLPRGGGYPAGVRNAERYIYVKRGVLGVDVDGEVLEAKEGAMVHMPPRVPHGLHAITDAVELLVAADTQEPAFDMGGVSAGVGEAPQTSSRPGPRTQYVYPIDELNEIPQGVLSAVVMPKNFVSKKSSSYGAALKGESLQVGVIHKAKGSGAKLHTHPNEQFNVVLEGRIVGEIDGCEIDAPLGHLLHMPAGVVHRTFAGPESDITVFVVKDNRHGMSGPPVDGVEDGPQFLAGFGPR